MTTTDQLVPTTPITREDILALTQSVQHLADCMLTIAGAIDAKNSEAKSEHLVEYAITQTMSILHGIKAWKPSNKKPSHVTTP